MPKVPWNCRQLPLEAAARRWLYVNAADINTRANRSFFVPRVFLFDRQYAPFSLPASFPLNAVFEN